MIFAQSTAAIKSTFQLGGNGTVFAGNLNYETSKQRIFIFISHHLDHLKKYGMFFKASVTVT